MNRLLGCTLTAAVLLTNASVGNAVIFAQTTEQSPALGRVAALIRAFDQGALSGFREFVRDNYDDSARDAQDIERAADYWASVRREIGPIELIRSERLPIPGRENVVWWVRGTVTKAVVALRVDVDPQPPHRVVRTGVMRGPDPMQGRDPVVRPDDLAAYLESYLSAAAQEDFFSGVMVLAQGDEILFEGAYGWADREAQTPATVSTPFKLASATKMFTGVAIAQLAEKGLLSFEDTIDRYVPEYPAHIGSQVTLHHLLTHTSGIEIDNDPDYQQEVRRANSLDDLLNAQLRFIDRLNLGNYENFKPLGRFDYTNEGLDLLGVIVTRASGMPWRDYVRTNVLRRAGMEHAGTDLLDPVPGLATGYTVLSDDLRSFLPGTRRRVGADETGARLVIRPAGSGYATGRDMVRFLAALQDGRLLGAASVELVTRQHVAQASIPGASERGYGYTFMIGNPQGVRTVGHTGGATGMSTLVEFHPDLGTTLVVLSNYDRVADHYAAHVRELLASR